MAGIAHSYTDPVTGCVHLTLRGMDPQFAHLVGEAQKIPRPDTFKSELYGYAWTVHRSLVIHEWAHVLQLATYPFLFLRSARAGRVMAGPGLYLRENPGRHSLPLQVTMDERWRMSSMLGTIGFHAQLRGDGVKLSAVEGDAVRRGVLTERDLIEEDATVFQFRAEIAARGKGAAYRNWLRERPRYSRLFSFLVQHLDEDVAMRVLPILVRVAYRTTRPLEGFFRSFGAVLQMGAPDDPDEDEALERVLLDQLREGMGTLGPSDLTMDKPELDDPAGVIGDDALDELARAYAQLPFSLLTQIDRHGSDDQRGIATAALRRPWEFFDRYAQDLDERLTDYLPPAITVSLDHPAFPMGSSLLAPSPLLAKTPFAAIEGVTFGDWTSGAIKGRAMWRGILTAAAGPNARCPHRSCPYHASGMCREWLTIPKAPEDCEFPEFLARSTNHQISADGTALEPVPTG